MLKMFSIKWLIRKIKMIISLIFLCIILSNIFTVDCAAQARELITRPYLKLVNDSLIIKYDIISYNSDDKFNIWLEITDATGKKINAYSLEGDFGDNINAGRNKQIIWDLAADNIFLNANINVEIIANKVIIPVTVKEDPLVTRKDEEPKTVRKEEEQVAVGKRKELADKSSEKVKKEEAKKSPRVTKPPKKSPSRVKTGKHLLQSAIIPGWGMTAITDGKPYWLIGVAGAGCAATSVYFNFQADVNYNNYLDSNDETKINTYFEDAEMQYNISKVLAVTAAAIWVADLGIVGIKAHRMNKKNRLSAFSIGSSIEPKTETPMLTLYFNF